MAVTSNWAPRVADGHATWNHTCKMRSGGECWRKKKEREERRKDMKIKLKVGSLNVGTMTGKSREIVDMMECRNVDVLCVQETRWKGAKARCMREGYKIWYCSSDSKRNGVGIIIKKDLVDRMVEVWRSSDRMIGLKLELDGAIINIISVYVPQQGCTLEEKEVFWSDLEETVEMILRGEGDCRS